MTTASASNDATTTHETIDLFGDGKYVGTKDVTGNGRVSYIVTGPRVHFLLMAYMDRSTGTPSRTDFFLVRANGNVTGASIRGNRSFRILPDGKVHFW